MSRSLSPAAIASGNDSETEEVWLVLLSITHASIIDGPLRLVNDFADLTSRGYVFTAMPFALDLPGEDSSSITTATIRVDNVDRRIVQAIRDMDTPPVVNIEVVLASQPDTVEIALPDLVLRNATYDAGIVTGDLSYEQVYVEPVSVIMNPARFPGIF